MASRLLEVLGRIKRLGLYLRVLRPEGPGDDGDSNGDETVADGIESEVDSARSGFLSPYEWI